MPRVRLRATRAAWSRRQAGPGQRGGPLSPTRADPARPWHRCLASAPATRLSVGTAEAVRCLRCCCMLPFYCTLFLLHIVISVAPAPAASRPVRLSSLTGAWARRAERPMLAFAVSLGGGGQPRGLATFQTHRPLDVVLQLSQHGALCPPSPPPPAGVTQQLCEAGGEPSQEEVPGGRRWERLSFPPAVGCSSPRGQAASAAPPLGPLGPPEWRGPSTRQAASRLPRCASLGRPAPGRSWAPTPALVQPAFLPRPGSAVQRFSGVLD